MSLTTRAALEQIHAAILDLNISATETNDHAEKRAIYLACAHLHMAAAAIHGDTDDGARSRIASGAYCSMAA